jgi:hypothetical protein
LTASGDPFGRHSRPLFLRIDRGRGLHKACHPLAGSRDADADFRRYLHQIRQAIKALSLDLTSTSSGFILGYHGWDRAVGERLLDGEPFQPSNNEYDWLGSGIYFSQTNPERGLDFALETSRRKPSTVMRPFVIGAVLQMAVRNPNCIKGVFRVSGESAERREARRRAKR